MILVSDMNYNRIPLEYVPGDAFLSKGFHGSSPSLHMNDGTI
jgi:hypothetical protein